eukprot:jgi/Botrbrau1/426/Bobra.110_2s0076.1
MLSHVCPNLDVLVPALVDGGFEALEQHCILTPGVPLKPMLAKIVDDIPDALKQVAGQGALAEYKYDGVRAQIHLLPDASVKIFSRNSEDRTPSFPDVVEAVREAVGEAANSLVLDAELVAIDRDTGRLRAFQELSTRPRAQVEAHQVTVPVCVFAFDLLYINGQPLVHLPLRARRERLAEVLPNRRAGFTELAKGFELPDNAPPDGMQPAEAPSGQIPKHKLPRTNSSGQTPQDKLLRTNSSGQITRDKLPRTNSSGQIPRDELPRTNSSGETPQDKPPRTTSSGQISPDIPLVATVSKQPHSPTVPRRDTLSPSPDQASCPRNGGALKCAVSLARSASSTQSASPDQAATPPHPAGSWGAPDDASCPSEKAPGGDPAGPEGREPRALRLGTAGDGEPAFMPRARNGGRTREEAVREFLQEAFAEGAEGLMLKALDEGASYQPSKRSESWLKIKKDYCEDLRDSLDLVPIGAWYGNGRKVGWFSPFLMAAWDPDSETFQSVCRCMSGFTDAFYTAATERLGARKIPARKPYYVTAESPDVWFEPSEVWELRGADLTISPVHKAAVGRIHPDRGISLRFPRFIRTREDKSVEEASDPDMISLMFSQQTRRLMGGEGG